MRTLQLNVTGQPADVYATSPWRAPGSAPVFGSGCGVAGGSKDVYLNGGSIVGYPQGEAPVIIIVVTIIVTVVVVQIMATIAIAAIMVIMTLMTKLVHALQVWMGSSCPSTANQRCGSEAAPRWSRKPSPPTMEAATGASNANMITEFLLFLVPVMLLCSQKKCCTNFSPQLPPVSR